MDRSPEGDKGGEGEGFGGLREEDRKLSTNVSGPAAGANPHEIFSAGACDLPLGRGSRVVIGHMQQQRRAGPDVPNLMAPAEGVRTPSGKGMVGYGMSEQTMSRPRVSATHSFTRICGCVSRI